MQMKCSADWRLGARHQAMKRYTLNITKFACFCPQGQTKDGYISISHRCLLIDIEYVEPQNCMFLIFDFLRRWHSEICICDSSILADVWSLPPGDTATPPYMQRAPKPIFMSEAGGFKSGRTQNPSLSYFPKGWQSFTHIDTLWHIVHTQSFNHSSPVWNRIDNGSIWIWIALVATSASRMATTLVMVVAQRVPCIQDIQGSVDVWDMPWTYLI